MRWLAQIIVLTLTNHCIHYSVDLNVHVRVIATYTFISNNQTSIMLSLLSGTRCEKWIHLLVWCSLVVTVCYRDGNRDKGHVQNQYVLTYLSCLHGSERSRKSGTNKSSLCTMKFRRYSTQDCLKTLRMKGVNRFWVYVWIWWSKEYRWDHWWLTQLWIPRWGPSRYQNYINNDELKEEVLKERHSGFQYQENGEDATHVCKFR